MIGLAGAHRTGKTTLARAYAKKRGLEFVETSASQVFRDMGLDPAAALDFSTRLRVQEEILARFDALYATHMRTDMAITDRTPLDMLAYTLADATGDVVGDEDQARLERYVRKCFEVTNKRFGVLVVVQPGIALVAEEGKAALNNAYIEHLNSLILGLSVDERLKSAHFYIPRSTMDLGDRIGALDFAVGRAKRRVIDELEDAVVH